LTYALPQYFGPHGMGHSERGRSYIYTHTTRQEPTRQPIESQAGGAGEVSRQKSVACMDGWMDMGASVFAYVCARADGWDLLKAL
jgi:hypothetical protein